MAERSSDKKYGILMVATNEYVILWQQTILSLKKSASGSISLLNIHLFTNQIELCEEWLIEEGLEIDVIFHRIPGWGWPEATLLRYEFFEKVFESLNEDVLIYLDSDMQIRKNFIKTLNPEEWENGIALVAHPGYVGFKDFRGALRRVRYPRILFLEVLRMILKKPQGTWETRQNSTAFVPRNNRKNYVHGAIWMGKNKDLKRMIRILSKNTAQDLKSGIIAQWHDESHLNWYCSNFNTTILDSRYSGFDKYKHLKSFDSMIVTIEKKNNFGRLDSQIEIR